MVGPPSLVQCLAHPGAPTFPDALCLPHLSLYSSTCLCALTLAFFLAILGLELKAYTLSHSTSPFL
jgi:hypothetical protein